MPGDRFNTITETAVGNGGSATLLTPGAAQAAFKLGAAPSQPARAVCMLLPGGFEHSGGIGRWAGYLFAAWPSVPNAPELEVIDTRGHGGLAVALTSFLSAIGKLSWLWATRRLGLVHVNLSVRGSTVRKCVISSLARWGGVPVIIHLHSGRFPEFYQGLPRWAQGAVRRMFDTAACVIVPGQIWKDMLVSELGVRREAIRVMPNAVAEPLKPPPRQTDAPCHIVMLGRVGPPKGLPELMQALSSSIMRDLPWRITIAGDGDPDTYRKEAVTLGIADKVTILGWLDQTQVAALLGNADVFVLPSRSENLPVAVIEALSFGIPVVTTPVGAVPEIVQNEVSALLVPIRDPDALAGALARMVLDPVLRQRIGEAGHCAFRTSLEIGQCARSLASLYEEMTATGVAAQHHA